MPGQRETKRVLIVVRTYPTPARTGVEVSCTAGITDDGKWIRLFPVPYRFLHPDKRFSKYQWIDVRATKASKDPRPESYTIDRESIKIISEIGPEHEWRARKKIVDPLVSHCLCCLKREWEKNKAPTLGLFRPRTIRRLLIQPASATWTATQLEILRQGSLFENAPETELEKVPYTFKYDFQCDDDACKGHLLGCTDWEMGQSWRSWHDKYGETGWREQFLKRYEAEMIQKYDTHFYVGTVNNHPKEWMVVGLFYPPRQRVSPQGQLF